MNVQTHASQFASLNVDLTAKRRDLRHARRQFLFSFDEDLQQLFGELNESTDKCTARRAVTVHVLTAIEKLCSELAIPENTKEDVEYISRRLLGMVSCYGWDAYEKTIAAINEEYCWRQRDDEWKWVMPLSVVQKMAEVSAKFELQKVSAYQMPTIHPGGKRQQTADEKRARLKRRDDRRAALLAAQPKKGASPPPPNSLKNPGGKKAKAKK